MQYFYAYCPDQSPPPPPTHAHYSSPLPLHIYTPTPLAPPSHHPVTELLCACVRFRVALKGSNILLNDGRHIAKVADFGTALDIGGDSSDGHEGSVKRSGSFKGVIGSQPWLAPEVGSDVYVVYGLLDDYGC